MIMMHVELLYHYYFRIIIIDREAIDIELKLYIFIYLLFRMQIDKHDVDRILCVPWHIAWHG